MTATVTELTADGRPAEATFRFDEPLESPSFAWLCFRGDGFAPFTPPVYPSYPPPSPAPLRGIQIQIRVADPTNQRIKSLTIRQDFTDKLCFRS